MWIRWSETPPGGRGGLRQPQTPPLSARGGVDRACGRSVLPLPPYSSDYDPIEELLVQVQGQLRRIAARTKDGLYKAVGETLDSVTIQDILAGVEPQWTVTNAG